MGLMEPRCKLEGFGRPAQLAVPNRLRCRALVAVSGRYLGENLLRNYGALVLAYTWRKNRNFSVPGIEIDFFMFSFV
jgi:hypothetical protein